MRCLAVIAAVMVAAGAGSAHAQVTLDNAWMRPAHAGQPQAAVYVDIRAAQGLKLVGASTPAAKRAELVRVDPLDPEKPRVVDVLPVAANAETRLALGGDHIRLVDVARDILPSEQVPLTLDFLDAAGTRQSAHTQILVRGLRARPPPPAPGTMK